MKLSLDEVMNNYQDSVFKAAFYILKDRYDAEDVVQETFLSYYKEGKEFEGPEHIKNWLLRIAINKSKNITASFWRKKRDNIDDYIENLYFEMPEDKNLLREVLRLPEKCRVIVHLYYYEGYSIKEIASIIGLSENTIKSQLHRGRKLLKDRLEEEWVDE